ncbi:MAG TPA: flagellar hook-associated protein FlgL [Pirellulales bacterium]|jgi:flagellar hook-associated protein 3|nr:flagellar hook-associated protein FlgL [Pirellulales bacterium]
MSILPVPTTRVSQILVGQRLINQFQSQEGDLLTLESQISSGQRISLPSQDAPAALRAIDIKGLLLQQAQVATNLQTGQDYLNATGSALADVSDTVSNLRATAISVSGTTATDDQRTAAVSQIDSSLQSLVNIANQQFNGSYIFGGSANATPPFSISGNYVTFNGNSQQLQSLVDQNFFLPTNVSAQQAFGALSPPIQSADLDPQVTADTKLRDLHNGQGIALGSVVISDGTHSSTVDLSNAETVGDVATALQTHAPAGRTVSVQVTATGLQVSLDAAGGGQLSINDVNGGTTAADLGILHPVGSNTGPIVGTALDPQVVATTPLADLFGTRAAVDLTSAGANNDLHLEAVQRGASLNGVAVSFVNNPSILEGHETVAYDANANTLVFQVRAGQTNANDIVNALNSDPAAGAVFHASLGAVDSTNAANAGLGKIDASLTGSTAGGSGIEPDLTSGLQIVNGGQTYTVDLSSAKNVGDLVSLLNTSPAGVLAQINSSGNGISIQSRISGGDFSIGENGGQTATVLGLRTFTGDSKLADFNHGTGVHSNNSADFVITRKDGSQLTYNVGGLTTVNDVLNLINNDPNNQGAHQVTAQLDPTGNGIQLVTSDPATTAALSVATVNNSQAANDLGLIAVGKSASDPAVTTGGVTRISGRDVNPTTVGGVFDSILRVRQALLANDSVSLTTSLNNLDSGATQIQYAEAEVGARQQSLTALQTRQTSQTLDLKTTLSNAIDTDVAQASIDFQSKQSAFEASLKVAATISQLSLINFL